MGFGMNSRMQYQVALVKGGSAEIYESTAVMAASNLEAVEKARNWTSSFERIADDAWLQINLNGIGIRSLRPGDF